MSLRHFLKICCIASVQEADAAIVAGASAIGLVAEMPSGPGTIDDRRIAEIAAATKGRAQRFLLSSRTSADALIAHVDATGVDTLQIVDHVDAQVREQIRLARPELNLVQVVHVENPASVEWGLVAAQTADMLLLDSGRLVADVRELGGTGRTHDWSLSAEIVRRSPIPTLLAGGIGAHNVALALEQVMPHGIDLCSSVRTDDRLHPGKLSALVAAMGA